METATTATNIYCHKISRWRRLPQNPFLLFLKACLGMCDAHYNESMVSVVIMFYDIAPLQLWDPKEKILWDPKQFVKPLKVYMAKLTLPS